MRVWLMCADASVLYIRSREPSLRDEILVFVVMAAMFLGLLIIVNFTRTLGRRRLYYMTFDEMPLMWPTTRADGQGRTSSSPPEPSRRLLHLFGTVCRSQYAHRRHCKFFAADWRPSFLPGRTAALTKSVSERSQTLPARTCQWASAGRRCSRQTSRRHRLVGRWQVATAKDQL